MVGSNLAERLIHEVRGRRDSDVVPEIIVEPNEVRVPAAEGDTVMAALNKNGYTFLLGCRRGGCGICKVRVVEGTIEHNRPVAESALPAEERAEGVCLGCRAVPQGEIRIALLKSALRVTNPLLHPPAA